MQIKTVGVIGAGLMGSGIAQVTATAGYKTIVRELTDELVEKGLSRITQSLTQLVEKGKMSTDQQQAIEARLQGTTDDEPLAECDLIIEAIIEQLPEKIKTFTRLDQLCRPEAIFASNTSSLSITEMMAALQPARQPRFVGLHFFNPVPVMKLVEVIRTILTDPDVYQTATAFAQSLDKVAVQTTDRTGFIVNRLLVPYLLDAVRALEEGVASITDLDNAMKLGCGHPMGPLTLLDFVGLDTTYFIANVMFDEFKEKRFAAPPLLKRMVMAGLHGRKTGKGFYDYTDPKNPKPMPLL
ncbi:MAG: 3-hydroxybutyryl-CoA dehydrogenase [Acidobacteriota bacterium]|nr:3-hydroxybutyryl-CoA dehydrogenase [Blastocatellia bacterium]MDW8240120.1 3-hydroxybutyryl-CoA dehydrogenase [Acidobacteriota bacterium]